MAQIAHVEGKVVLSIIISPEGKVGSVRAISGHPILIQSTVDAVHQWEYRPFIADGRPQTVAAMVEVTFALGSLPKTVSNEFTRYDEQETKCLALLNQQSYAAAETVCALLPGLAEKAHGLARERAYDLSGYAYFKVSKFQEALTAWRHQFAILKDTSLPGSPRLGEAYFNVGRALQATGDLKGAGSNYEHAKRALEAAHKKMPEVDVYSENLRAVLKGYASLLRQMGEQTKAEALEKEAEAISVKPGSQK